jgi:hypothetical protein
MDRPDIGHGVAGVLGIVGQYITDRTGLQVYFEPMPAEAREVHLTFIPRTFDVQREERRRMNLHDLYTAMLTMDVFLSADGAGQEFMAECMEAALMVARLFYSPITVNVGAEIHATLSCTRKESGQFMASSDEGSQDYQYSEPWEGTLLFPYAFETDQTSRVIDQDGMWPIDVQENGG